MAHLSSPESDAKTNFPRQKLPSAAPPETILENSSSGMPGASRSTGHAPLGTRCHAVDGIWWQKLKFNFSRGELRKTSSRPAAPSALVSKAKHLEWSKRMASKWLLQVRPFATVYFTFLAFQCCQMLSKKQPREWPWTPRKKNASNSLTNWPNIATKFARQGTNQSLLLLNWSSWRRAVSATQRREFDSNH